MEVGTLVKIGNRRLFGLCFYLSLLGGLNLKGTLESGDFVWGAVAGTGLFIAPYVLKAVGFGKK